MMGNVIRARDLYEDEKKSKDSSSPARRGSLPVLHCGSNSHPELVEGSIPSEG